MQLTGFLNACFQFIMLSRLKTVGIRVPDKNAETIKQRAGRTTATFLHKGESKVKGIFVEIVSVCSELGNKQLSDNFLPIRYCASGHPQHLRVASFDCCIERYEIVV